MAQILSGITVRDSLVGDLIKTIQTLPTKPTLVIFQIGNREDSNSYIRQKKIFAEKIGARVEHKTYAESVTEKELLKAIQSENMRQDVHGIIIQMPLPAHLNKKILIEAINPMKDVDGLTSHNAALLYMNDSSGLVPATAQGIINLLDFYNIQIEGKKVVVVGRSMLVGKPTALALLNRDATVTVAHRHTKNLSRITNQADILIVAIGKPEFITSQYVAPHQIVIDVGITALEKDGKRKMFGDCAYYDIEPIVEAVTPVPGGVGPMTVTALFQNLLKSYRLQKNT